MFQPKIPALPNIRGEVTIDKFQLFAQSVFCTAIGIIGTVIATSALNPGQAIATQPGLQNNQQPVTQIKAGIPTNTEPIIRTTQPEITKDGKGVYTLREVPIVKPIKISRSVDQALQDANVQRPGATQKVNPDEMSDKGILPVFTIIKNGKKYLDLKPHLPQLREMLLLRSQIAGTKSTLPPEGLSPDDLKEIYNLKHILLTKKIGGGVYIDLGTLDDYLKELRKRKPIPLKAKP